MSFMLIQNLGFIDCVCLNVGFIDCACLNVELLVIDVIYLLLYKVKSSMYKYQTY